MTAVAAAAAAATVGCGGGAPASTGTSPAGTGTSPAGTSPGGTVTHLREVNAPWRLASVRANGRVLVLRYDAGGCLRRDGRAVVSESKHRVLVTVREHELLPGSYVDGVEQICTSEQYTPTLRVRLSAPLAGRPVVGGPRLRRP